MKIYVEFIRDMAALSKECRQTESDTDCESAKIRKMNWGNQRITT